MRDFSEPGIVPRMRRIALVPLTALLAAGCGDAPALASLTSAATETPHESTSSASEATTTGAEPPISETSTSDASTDAGETVEPGSTGEPTTGPVEPALPPKILNATLTPSVLEVEGPIAAHALAEEADGVRMQIDGGEPIELDEVAPGEFAGELGVYTSLANGTHDVAFTAWKDEQASDALVVQYEAALKPAGGEAFWDASGVLGAGFGRGVAVDQVNGWVYEAGDFQEDGQNRCYVRRRGPQGEYLEADLVEVLADKSCTATAITIAEDGTLHVLAEAVLNGKKVWWLGRKDSWDAPMLTLAWGLPGEKAYALAQHPDAAEVAVCGTAPTNAIDAIDGMVAIFRKGLPGYRPAPFDYRPDAKTHLFAETLRDCAYNEDVLALAGEAYGKHPDSMTKIRDRLVLVEYDTLADTAVWTVAGIGPGLAVQSGARSIAVTDAGTYLTYGFTCEDDCKSQLHLREFLPGGVPSGWNVLPPVNATLATDIVWSPAGYAIISAGKVNGPWWTEFWSQGWVPGQELPVWSYSHLDQPNLHAALAIAVAKFGRIYIVGIAGQGDLTVPAFAIVDP